MVKSFIAAKAALLLLPGARSEVNTIPIQTGECPLSNVFDISGLLSRVASIDQQQCIPCSVQGSTASYRGVSTFRSSTNECTCGNPVKGLPTGRSIVTKKLVEIYDEVTGFPIGKDCLRCPGGTAVITTDLYQTGQEYHFTAGVKFTADPHQCSSCPDPNMFFDTDYSCVCSNGYILTGEASLGVQTCIERYPTISSGYAKVEFKSPRNIVGSNTDSDFSLESMTFSHLYLKAASDCEYFKGATGKSLQSCQTLANLCVMSFYDKESPACMQFETIAQRRIGTYHKQEDWKYSLPWLYYRDEADIITEDRGIDMKMSFNEQLAKYTLDGKFVGIEDLTIQMEYCYDPPQRDDINQPRWLSFGNGHRNAYSCSLSSLLDRDMYFYDMYIVDASCNDTDSDPLVECFYPVPVLNRNLVDGNDFPNFNQQPLDESNDRYTRRFFLFDSKAGKTASGTEAIRYAKTIQLQVVIQSENPNRVYPPRLVIEYATATSVDIDNTKDLLVFKVDYSMKTENFWSSIQVILGFTAYLVYIVIRQCQSETILVDWERPIQGKNQVSMWRSVLVTNFWNKMQTQRKQSIEFSLLLVGFFMLGLGTSTNASPQPNFDDSSNEHVNIALRFANSCFYWAIASISQWLWRFLLYERYITEPPAQKFVDLCTVCNISVFIMTEHNKGYYLHCRSPYQSSDCSMEELLDQLKKEANGTTISRGLDGSSNEDQVFVLYCSSAFHRQIGKIYMYVKNRRVDEVDDDADNRMAVAKAEMSSFLRSFIDQQPPPTKDELMYSVREPWLVERLFGVTPADFRTQSEPKCILQPDETRWNRDYEFISTTFLGIELDLFIHDVLTYNMADMAFNNPAISMVVTYAMHLARTSLISYFGQKNLAETTLINERFIL
ncbi:predicted protein [Thalassiosira pseudonana CCMP1335]|uniref:Meckelin n=1 Tax=Thalassiosira pseudonana TaxID=35128 RepID=B8BRX8_THAPS|nr:predicted protein [Thalassiosira pseudonana CCMP1335]EED96619.1 predicted protein [Thalassiosira pseudonana CCMP1335]